MQFVLLGMVLTFLGGSTNYFLWYGINIPPYGNLLAASFVIFTAYAILRYRFMDIRVIIRRSAVFTVLVAIITSIYALIAYLITLFFQNIIGTQSAVINGIITAVLVALGFEPLKKWLSLVTDNYLFKAEYKPQAVLAEFSDYLTSTLNLENLSKFIAKKLNEVFKAQFISLFIYNEKTKEYKKASLVGKTAASLEVIDKKLFDRIFGFLGKIGMEKDIFVREEIPKLGEHINDPVFDLFYKTLQKYEVNIVVPLYIQNKLIALLFLGDKKSGDIFSQEDLKVLEIIAQQSSVAIKNAQLFEEQRHFTEHLKMEVDKATKELKAANIQLKKLDQAKSDFVSIASHQLRTPLTVIKGYLSMFEQGDYGKIPPKLALPFDRVYKSTNRIIGLVEDLLNVSRLESGRMKYEFARFDLSALAHEVFEELAQHAKGKGLKFEYVDSGEKLPEIFMDKNRVREVLMNLMDNAIKYTDAGFVRVKLVKTDGNLEFSVTDSGRGIGKDEMPALFQKFSRASGAQLQHTEGTGLGLYIAKEILEKHGARIWAESPGKGKGSTFIIRFKINNPQLEQEAKKIAAENKRQGNGDKYKEDMILTGKR